MEVHTFTATTRNETGSNASRRIRRNEGLPGILYGAGISPTPVTLSHHQMFHLMKRESFHSAILDMELDGKVQKVLLRDYQYHPYKPRLLHMDFQKVSQTQEIHVTVPLHFINAETAPGVKLKHGIPSHVMIEIGVTCLPKDLPPFLEVDMGNLDVSESIHAKSLSLPGGVSLTLSPEDDPVICTILAPMKEEPEITEAPVADEEEQEKDDDDQDAPSDSQS